jgi:hypothetical protein
MNPVDLARRHWRFLAPTWLLPLVVMLLQVVEDITGNQRFLSQWFACVVLPVLLVSTVAAAYLQRREHLSWGDLYVITLVPMMAVWGALILSRAAILIPLGRPL